MVNLELPEELKMLKAGYIDGVGLFRTEYIYSDRDAFHQNRSSIVLIKKLFKECRVKL